MVTSRVIQLGCCLLYSLLLPVVLLAAAVVRYNALSFLYAVFLLILPLLSTPTPTSIRGGTGIYLRIVFIVALLGILAHAVFHITLSAIATDTEPYGSMFQNCSTNEKLARQFGLEPLKSVPAVDIVRLVLPEVIVFLTGLLVYVICYKLLPVEPQKGDVLPSTVTKTRRKSRVNGILEFIGEFLVVLLLAASGIVVPTVLSAVYFLSFIFMATLWSVYGRLGVKFTYFRIFLMIYCAAHILVLHLYQFQFFQDALPPDDFIARLIGLTGVVMTSCNNPYMIYFKDSSQWPYFLNPAILLCLYFMLAWETRHSCTKEIVDDVDSSEKGSKKRRGRRRNQERQVEAPHDKSQTEHLIEAEVPVPGYSSTEPVSGDRSGSPTMLGGDENDTADEMDGPQKRKPNLKRSSLVSVMVYIMRQSYVLSLIAMMAWSITFHSWLTFVLLLLACIIWMTSKSRKACLVMSPFVLFYGICLLVIQFIYGMNLKELPTEVNGVNLDDIGFKKFTYPCLQLALQVLYALTFWLTLRQYVREKRSAVLAGGEKYPLEPVEGSETKSPTSVKSVPEIFNFLPGFDTVDGYDSNTMKWLGQYLWCLLCKYWIFVCAGMLLVIALQEVVVYRIIYMFLFLFFILSFQFMYGFWRLTMFVFWWVVIIYSMAVLIILYTYQFPEFPGYWHNNTGLSYETLADLGLEQFDTAGLFVKLLTPTSFLIIIILQVHYFHKPFLMISALDRYKNTSETDSPDTPVLMTTDGGTTATSESESEEKTKKKCKTWGAQFRKLWKLASDTWAIIAWFLWRLAEIHIFKLVAFVIITVCVYEVSAVSAVYVILVVVFLPLTLCHFLMSHIVQFWTAIVLLAKMIYQLRLVDNSSWLTNCTATNVTYKFPFNQTIDNAEWAGMKKTDSISYYLRNYIGILLVIAFERIVVYHQKQEQNRPLAEKPKQGIIFDNIKRENADEGLVACAKYFLNFFFYKFGLELCYVMTAIAICVRVDAYSVLYAIFLGILLALSRYGNAVVWPIYTIILMVLLPAQFLLSLGLPLGFCYEYVWDQESMFARSLEKWLYLPDYIYSPNPVKLVADFFQLLFVCLQWRVFRTEAGRSQQDEHDGGKNTDIIPEVEAQQPIPVEDFTTKIASYLDVLKNFVFTYMFWVTLAIVFIAGTTRINLFSMGYVIAVFCFMWFGQEFLIKPIRKLVRAWNFLIGYCYFVLLVKAAMQLPGCVYMDVIEDNACWLVQLLGLTCLRPAYNYTTRASCFVEEDNTGLAWDVVCFVFLLLQRRIYTSHYFRHVVSDIEAQNRLSSRGAELINRILMREVSKQRQEEKKILDNIKAKMNQLKDKQMNIKKTEEPEDHFQAIRSGDYYLFEDTDDEDMGESDKEVDTITFGTDKDEDGGLSPLQLITTAVTSGTDEALKKSEEHDDKSQASQPTSPKSPRSKDHAVGEEQCEDEAEEEEAEDKGGIVGKLLRLVRFIVALLISCADWLTTLFNRISRNYRLVAAKLKDDHIRVKQQIQSEQALLKESSIEMETRGEGTGETQAAEGEDATDKTGLVEVRVEPVEPSTSMTMVPSQSSISDTDLGKFDEEEQKFEEGQPHLYRLLVATYYVLIARSELVCYFLMILNHILAASLLSLPLPMFVFLWGMLSVPRPAKTFWITVITYTEAVVVVKYLFQFNFFSWNEKTLRETDPFWPPRILGIEQKDSFAVMDLILLLALFIHRTILKRYGLWKDAEDLSKDQDKAEKKELPPSSIEETTDGDAEPASDRQLPEQQEAATAEPSSLEGSTESQPDSDKGDKPGIAKKLVMPFIMFYKQLTCPDYSATTDVYAPMFACDFINFLIIVFGYWAFGPAQAAGGDVSSYISEDRVPVPFLIMLITQFILIVIDRALYLRKNVLGKFIFQILLVVLIHVWMFFLLPAITNRPFAKNTPAQLWYFIKCVYFALSAYQIRSAYPTRILGNFLTKKYNYVNLFLYKGFLAIPFLLELRTMMDWMWTDTTMAIGSWLQMEDIYANIYVLKCWRVAEKNHPTPRAQPKKALIKYGVGGLLLFIIIFIIWFPLVIFSFANTVYVPNPPKEVSVTVAIGGYQPLFTVSGQRNIQILPESTYSGLKDQYNRDTRAINFLNNYEAEDVTEITLDGRSTALWSISPPSRNDLIRVLQDKSQSVTLELSLTFTRAPNSQAGESLSYQNLVHLTEAEKNQTAELIVGNSTSPVRILSLFPHYMRLSGKSADLVKSLVPTYKNVNIMKEGNNTQEWWKITMTGDNLQFYTFNDRVAPAGLSLITGYGIIGLYVSFILLIGRIIRLSTTGLAAGITYKELPFVDNILRLCLDLYLVREMKEFRLEEDLYAKLIFVFRSAETRVRWTRMPISEIIETKKNL